MCLAILVMSLLVVGELYKRFNHVEETSGKDSEKEAYTVGISMGTLKEERWIRDRDVLVSKLREKGMNVIVQNANNDDADQIKQVEYLIEKSIDVLIIVPNDLTKAARAVEMAKEKGIKVISYDRLVLNANVDLYITFDNEMVGQLMAESISETLDEGKILIINGSTTDYNTTLIKNGYDQVLQPFFASGRYTLVDEVWADDWRREYAYEVTVEQLQEGVQLDAIICGDDALAGAALEGLNLFQENAVYVVGQDADLQACQRVVKGEQLMTIYKPIAQLAQRTADIAYVFALGENYSTENSINDGSHDIPYVVLTPIAITKDNMDDTIIRDGFHTREEVYP